ncbi:hypothetical protein Tco_0725016 [Tanacetum coccineum]|uniref:Uncharacterized protein n=1 Tax=Tanacetum coccineum TaxID=301880 RepID=A0ABQ4YBP2_9ASTR
MDDPNMIMEEYIKLEEEKAHRRGRVFNWQTTTYEKIKVNDDLHDLSSVEAEFPAIVINDAFAPQDAPQCKSQVSTPVNDEIDFRISFDESDDEDYTIILSEYYEEEQNILYFNDLFHFNIIHPDDLKSEKDNDNNEIDITQSSEDMALPPHEQRHQFIRYEGLEYTDTDIEDFEARIARIYRREVHRVQVFDFGGLPDLMVEELSVRMLMEHRDDQGVSLFTSGLRPAVWTLGRWFTSLFWSFSVHLGLVRPYLIWIRLELYNFSWDELGGISSVGDFLGTTPSYTMIQDPILRLCHRLIPCTIAGRSQAPEKRKNGAYISGGRFVALLAEHFGILTAEILGGLTVIAPELPIIDMAELVRLQICAKFDDTWAWVAMGPERQPDAAAGAPVVAEDALAANEGDQAIRHPMQAPHTTNHTLLLLGLCLRD